MVLRRLSPRFPPLLGKYLHCIKEILLQRVQREPLAEELLAARATGSDVSLQDEYKGEDELRMTLQVSRSLYHYLRRLRTVLETHT